MGGWEVEWVGGVSGQGVGSVAAKKLNNGRGTFHWLGIIYPQAKSFPTDELHTHQSAFGAADKTAYLSTHAPNLDRR